MNDSPLKYSDKIHVSWFTSGMCGAELFPAGRGEDKNPRGGAGQGGAGRGKRTRKSTDPKIRQKCVYCYGDICSVL